MSPYEGDQSELDKPEVAQQPTFEESYPAGIIVRLKKNGKVIQATVMGPVDKVEFSVPSSDILPCSTPDPTDILLIEKDIDPNALENLITKEDLEKLWQKDQGTLSDGLRVYLY
eukprot:6047295-Ditylum_brightwellii.AAC.1